MISLLLALSLSADLNTSNVAAYPAEAVYTYNGRTVTIEWCHPAPPGTTFDLEIVNEIGEYREVSESGLTAMSYDWQVPRSGTYTVRVRARYPGGELSAWSESETNGDIQTTGCEAKPSFILNSVIAPPSGGGGFEN